MNRSTSTFALINVSLFSLFWALQLIVSKMAFQAGAQPVSFALHQGVVALLFLMLLFFRSHIKSIVVLPKSVLIGILLANSIHFGFGTFFGNAGVALTSAVNAGFLVKFTLATTILLAWIVLKEPLTKLKIGIALLMLTGSYLISTGGKSLVPHIGDVLIIMACLSWSTGNILVRKALHGTHISGDLISLMRPIAGLPTLLVFIALSPLYPPSVQQMFAISYANFQYAIYFIPSGIFTALLWIYLNRTLKVATASYMTMMSTMTSLIVLALAVLVLRESVSLVQIAGGALIIISSVVTHLFGERRK